MFLLSLNNYKNVFMFMELFLFFAELGIEPSTVYMWGKYPTTEIYPQLQLFLK
jgi:hypothetical protein